MKIMNKQQFAKTKNGTVYCLYKPDILDEEIRIKNGYFECDNEPYFNGVISLCPWFCQGEKYNRTPSDKKSYYTETFFGDTALCDYDEDQLFAVFSKSEIRRMIDVLTYALCNCEGSDYAEDIETD